MDEQQFWRLISTIDVAALRAGDEEGAVRPLRTALSQLETAALEAFEDLLAASLYDLDGEEFARHAGESGGSDDGFLYARCYVVASGRDQYEAVRADPRRMPKSIDQWCEALLSVHTQAWAETTGRDESEWDHVPSVDYESGSNLALWPSRRGVTAEPLPDTRFSVAKVIWNDWVALFSALTVPIVWAVHLAFPYLRDDATPPIPLTAGLSVLALTALAWRAARVKALFDFGRRAQGLVTDLRLTRDRGRLAYSYPVDGTIVETWCPVHRTKDVLALRVVARVEILYDAKDPQRSIVRELFAS